MNVLEIKENTEYIDRLELIKAIGTKFCGPCIAKHPIECMNCQIHTVGKVIDSLDIYCLKSEEN